MLLYIIPSSAGRIGEENYATVMLVTVVPFAVQEIITHLCLSVWAVDRVMLHEECLERREARKLVFL
jgi:hypothetical protein